MTQVTVVWEEMRLTLDDLAHGCATSREWVMERVQAGLLAVPAEADAQAWRFSDADLSRARRLHDIERRFEANPELAALVADLEEEVMRLRARMRRAGVHGFD